MPRVTYKARWKAFYDKKQTILDPANRMPIRFRRSKLSIEDALKTDVVTCPFCLYIGRLWEFQYMLPTGKMSKMARCPDCHNRMQLRTLTQDMTVEQYAKWCFEYALSGFWDKVPFQKFRNRLYKLRIANRFWNEYSRLKG